MSTLTPAMTPEALDTTDVGTGDDLEARVIVFNCDCHTYQQVIALFCTCIPGMNSSRADRLYLAGFFAPVALVVLGLPAATGWDVEGFGLLLALPCAPLAIFAGLLLA